jgi:hypothetical protein
MKTIRNFLGWLAERMDYQKSDVHTPQAIAGTLAGYIEDQSEVEVGVAMGGIPRGRGHHEFVGPFDKAYTVLVDAGDPVSTMVDTILTQQMGFESDCGEDACGSYTGNFGPSVSIMAQVLPHGDRTMIEFRIG